MSEATQSMVTLRIDGRTVRAPEGAYVLDVARKAGIEIPTLCNHPDLEPVGACRLCMVEVTHPDWKGWSGLMTACLYPVKDGIEVSTKSDRVIASRRGILSLLVARCPHSDTIKALADQYGARADGLTTDPNADNCILCGLCTRVCETYATGAITTVGRGAVKRVSSFGDQPPGECIGCGACVNVCPTGEVKGQRTASEYQVWSRAFPTAICTVDTAACIGCGSCEEACPFSVARVALRAGGVQTAVIPEEHCRGCGACVGACPTGAITQHGLEASLLCKAEPGQTRVFACTRSNLGRSEAARVVEMPCAGRVSVPMILHAVASGSPGVLVLGRHQRTCRFDGAEDPVRQRVTATRDVLDLIGLDPERVRFEEPAPGPDGPNSSVTQFQASLDALGNSSLRLDVAVDHEGLDTSLALVAAMSKHLDTSANGTSFLRKHHLPTAGQGPALLAGSIPVLHVLGKDLFSPLRLADTLRAAIDVLSHLGIPNVGIHIGTKTAAFGLERGADVTLIDDLLRSRGSTLPRPPAGTKVAFDGTANHHDILQALGYEPMDIGTDPLPDRFRLSPEERKLALARLVAAERAGAAALLVSDPRALARWAMVTRFGAWRASRVPPFLGVQLAHHAIHGIALGPSTPPPARTAPCNVEVAS
jgi:NAD-dependent dihydropyrimidine dehydrogenase PreA subunit/coenzyme F420-reducing hydrogenase delta subunit